MASTLPHQTWLPSPGAWQWAGLCYLGGPGFPQYDVVPSLGTSLWGRSENRNWLICDAANITLSFYLSPLVHKDLASHFSSLLDPSLDLSLDLPSRFLSLKHENIIHSLPLAWTILKPSSFLPNFCIVFLHLRMLPSGSKLLVKISPQLPFPDP